MLFVEGQSAKYSEEFTEATIGFVNPQPTKCPMKYAFSAIASDKPTIEHPTIAENLFCVSEVATETSVDKVISVYNEFNTAVDGDCNTAT